MSQPPITTSASRMTAPTPPNSPLPRPDGFSRRSAYGHWPPVALWSLRIPLEHLGARVYPDMFSFAQAHLGFDTDGHIALESLRERFEANIVNFMNLAEASKHYSCIKSAWIEFLGERPDPALNEPTTPVGAASTTSP